jgi:hypothetical protein
MLDINLLRPEKGGDPVRIIFVVAAKERVYLFPLSLSLSLSMRRGGKSADGHIDGF